MPTDLTDDIYINFMNGYIAPEFRLPNLSYDLNTHIWFDVVSGDERYYVIFGNYRIQYANAFATNETNRRPLIKLIEGSESGTSNVYYWDGIARRYNESITSTTTKYLHSSAWPGAIDNTTLTHNLGLNNPFTYQQYSGGNIINQMLLSNLQIQYRNSQGANYTFSSWDGQKSILQLSISLDDFNGTNRDHKMLSQYDGNTVWDCYNNEFVNHFKTSSYQTKTATNLFDTVKSTTYKSEYGMFFACNRQRTDTYWVDKNITWIVADSTTKLPSAGFIGGKSAYNLYQYKDQIKKSFRDKEWVVNPYTLQSGVPTLAAKKDDKISWNVKFDHVYCFNTTPNASGTNYDDNQNEVDIYLSYEPFTNLLTTGSPTLDEANLIKFTQNGVTKNYFTTTNREGKVEFEMKDDSVVYMKARPHWEASATYNGLNDWWDLYLNIDGDNGTFTATYE